MLSEWRRLTLEAAQRRKIADDARRMAGLMHQLDVKLTLEGQARLLDQEAAELERRADAQLAATNDRGASLAANAAD